MFRSRLPRIIAELEPALDEAMATAALMVAEQAKMRVPVETGRLRAAIHVERTGPAKYAVVAGDSEHNVFYGHIVEHGGVHQPAQPFLIPALEASRNDAKAIASEALRTL